MESLTKKCPGCGVMKSRGDFSPGNSRCRPCKTGEAVARYNSDKEYREKKKAWHRENERRKRADPVQNAKFLAKLREKRATNAEWRDKTLAACNARRTRLRGRELAIQARTRASRDGRECTITPEMIQERWASGPVCVYCGVVLEPGEGKFTNISPTLDRMDTSKGYTPENTAFACFRCNTLKRDATAEELAMLVANIRRVLAA